MPQPEENTPDVYTQTIERCAAAYHRVRAELKKDAIYFEDQENKHKAYLAFAAELPVLRDPDSFQLYVACIGKGAAIGAIDIVDIGRFCHIAQTAMSVWKLANLTIPAAQEKERAAKKKEEMATPLPSKGNHPQVPTSSQVGDALQYALAHLPMFEVQKQHFQELRNRGMILPCDRELRDSPLAALHFCRMNEELIRQDVLASIPPSPQPGPDPAPEQSPASQQAA